MKDNLKKFLLGIGLITGTIAFGIYDKKAQLRFDGTTKKEYVIGAQPMDINHDGIIDGWMIDYDLNQNGIKDNSAYYRIRIKNHKVTVDTYASLVVTDSDEDGIPDYYRIDTNDDKTLDKKVDLEFSRLRDKGV